MRKPTLSLRTCAFMVTGAALLFKSMATLAAQPLDYSRADGGAACVVGVADNGQRLCLLSESSPRRVRQNGDVDRLVGADATQIDSSGLDGML
jgi:hypothetical protein